MSSISWRVNLVLPNPLAQKIRNKIVPLSLPSKLRISAVFEGLIKLFSYYHQSQYFPLPPQLRRISHRDPHKRFRLLQPWYTQLFQEEFQSFYRIWWCFPLRLLQFRKSEQENFLFLESHWSEFLCRLTSVRWGWPSLRRKLFYLKIQRLNPSYRFLRLFSCLKALLIGFRQLKLQIFACLLQNRCKKPQFWASSRTFYTGCIYRPCHCRN